VTATRFSEDLHHCQTFFLYRPHAAKGRVELSKQWTPVPPAVRAQVADTQTKLYDDLGARLTDEDLATCAMARSCARCWRKACRSASDAPRLPSALERAKSGRGVDPCERRNGRGPRAWHEDTEMGATRGLSVCSRADDSWQREAAQGRLRSCATDRHRPGAASPGACARSQSGEPCR
jgi:hypothetical protein